ncbi:hypothetical protein [Alicyclobacillus fastidiosus]|uniref:hypothetical protein n=1 Tax=Alicyclobacillus fastidiosus TaxID=392011 RepID=UPI0023E96BE6|nr:hypothetical protein [Alicyclobacillus fastidiosus]GMA61918.1 hypothetical protein GCM10025859_23580 [Alicyclobacillus fastidiosus]
MADSSVLMEGAVLYHDHREDANLGKLPGRVGWTDLGQFTNHGIFQPSVGTIQAVMIFVDFPNAPVSEAPKNYQHTRPYYEWLVPGGRQWFIDASFGRMDVHVTPINRWYRMSKVDDTYGFQRGISSDQHTNYIQEAVLLAAADVDYSKYDVVYIVPCKNASGITFSPTHIDGGRNKVAVNGRVVTHAVTFGQDMWRWGYKVMNHETLHICGLPDLYAFEEKGNPSNSHYFVGAGMSWA